MCRRSQFVSRSRSESGQAAPELEVSLEQARSSGAMCCPSACVQLGVRHGAWRPMPETYPILPDGKYGNLLSSVEEVRLDPGRFDFSRSLVRVSHAPIRQHVRSNGPFWQHFAGLPGLLRGVTVPRKSLPAK